MKLAKKIAALLCCAGLALSTWAANYGAVSAYSNLVWSMSTTIPSLSTCNQIFTDIAGDFSHSNRFSVFGVLNCPANNTGYALTGTAYYGVNGLLNFVVTVGGYWQIGCGNMSGYSGSCVVLGPTGSSLGTAFIGML